MNPEKLDGVQPAVSEKMQSAFAMEREAHRLRGEGKIDQAFQTFDQAAKLFKESNEHLKAAVCFASAATCWNIHIGCQPLRNASTRNESAAFQALAAKDYGYAETLFSEAALLYEKEGDYAKYSDCYVRAKDSRLMRLWGALTRRRSKEFAASSLAEISLGERAKAFFKFFFSAINRTVWGYGEKPSQTLVIAAAIIIGSALCYYFSGEIVFGGAVRKIVFPDALYMSVITYATVGYGDYVPLGWVRLIASIEALSGIFITPLFLVALTRRYLRMYR